jgi:CRP-like cAMP-binding protein
VQLEKRTCSDGKMGLSLHPLLATVWAQATERRVVLPPLWEQAMASNHGNQVSTFRNEILASLSDDDIKALRPTLSRVSLVSQQVLHERATPIADVFFMENGIASLAADTLDEGQVEVGLTGWEGFVGASVVLNPDAFAVHRAFVQVEGSAYRMSAVALRTAIKQSDSLRDHCLRYVDLLMVQTSQAAACNARHNLHERLARWLLMTRDRVDTDHLPVTQEFLSIMRPAARDMASRRGRAGLPRADWRGGYPRCAPI